VERKQHFGNFCDQYHCASRRISWRSSIFVCFDFYFFAPSTCASVNMFEVECLLRYHPILLGNIKNQVQFDVSLMWIWIWGVFGGIDDEVRDFWLAEMGMWSWQEHLWQISNRSYWWILRILLHNLHLCLVLLNHRSTRSNRKKLINGLCSKSSSGQIPTTYSTVSNTFFPIINVSISQH
jgi:hypothetical protein